MNSDLEVVDGTAAGAWLKPRLLSGFGSQVQQQLPGGYEEYARIFHPARDESGKPVPWRDVAARLGRTPHRLMQWHAIIGASHWYERTNPRWPVGPPPLGELGEESLRALCAILSRFTSRTDRCYFALSTIRSGVEDAIGSKPLLELPNRDFVVLCGPLAAVNQVGFSEGPDRFESLSPSLIWPADHLWCSASEYEFDSTLVGGTRELIATILAASDLEAWKVYPDDSLDESADQINVI